MVDTRISTATSDLRRAAIFMVSIGAAAASRIFRYLHEEEIENLTAEIAKLDNISADELQRVNDEFHHMALAQDYISSGGITYAQEILENAVGEQQALDIVRRIQATLQIKGFNILRNVDINQLLSFLQKEHPQTIALVLSQLTQSQAAAVLTELSPTMQVDVMHRIARMERVSPDTLATVEKVLESHIDLSDTTSHIGGVKSAAEILNMVGQRFEKNILTGISKNDLELATQIKNLMFVFEDVISLDDRAVQKVLKEVDNRELAMALKACSEELKQKILANMSKRASEMILEELEYMGPVRLKEVEEVQQRIIDIIRRLEDEGEIVISSGATTDQFV
ncbi:MAG: flagellar motor switch protein FliG [Calditrichota bacterium]